MKRTLLVLACGILFHTAFAGGPIYSRYGVGDLVLFGSNRSYAMGGVAIGLIGDGFINRINPAGLAKISRTRFSGSFEFASMSLADPVGQSKFARGDFLGLALAIPLAPSSGAVLFAETSPYSYVHYKVITRENVGASSSTQTFTGQGGLSNLSIGTSYSPFSSFTLGVKVSYVYGGIDQFAHVDFDDATYSDNQIQTSYYHGGFSATVGATIESVGEVFHVEALKPLALGLLVTPPTHLSVKEERIVLTSVSSDTASVRRNKTGLPLTLGAGFSYTAGSRTLIAADVISQLWERENFFGKRSSDIRNSTRVALGLEFLPPRDASGYLERVAYRLGFAYNATYYRVSNRPINEWYVTGGVGLPLGTDSRLNIGLQAGTRGTTENNLQRNSFLRLSLSLSASEAWFLSMEED